MYICDLNPVIKSIVLNVAYPLNEQMEFLQVCIDISYRLAKAYRLDDFDHIYMAKHALSNVYQGYISGPVGDPVGNIIS